MHVALGLQPRRDIDQGRKFQFAMPGLRHRSAKNLLIAHRLTSCSACVALHGSALMPALETGCPAT